MLPKSHIDNLLTRLWQEYRDEGNQNSLDHYYALWHLKDKAGELNRLVSDYQHMLDSYRHEIHKKEEAINSLQTRVALYRQELDFMQQLREEETRDSSSGYRDNKQG